jgi:hypothetical protein
MAATRVRSLFLFIGFIGSWFCGVLASVFFRIAVGIACGRVRRLAVQRRRLCFSRESTTPAPNHDIRQGREFFSQIAAKRRLVRLHFFRKPAGLPGIEWPLGNCQRQVHGGVGRMLEIAR